MIDDDLENPLFPLLGVLVPKQGLTGGGVGHQFAMKWYNDHFHPAATLQKLGFNTWRLVHVYNILTLLLQERCDFVQVSYKASQQLVVMWLWCGFEKSAKSSVDVPGFE